VNEDEIEAATVTALAGQANGDDGPFSIGQTVWPGISKLIEECGELQQVMGKLVATGGRREHWSGDDLSVRLTEEMADVFAALDFVLEHNDLNPKRLTRRMAAKRRLFEAWHAVTARTVTPSG